MDFKYQFQILVWLDTPITTERQGKPASPQDNGSVVTFGET